MSIFRRLATVAAVLSALALVLAGCVKSDDTENALVNDPSKTSADIELPDNPKVVALGWSDGEVALSLGVKPAAIYDWMKFGEQSKGVGVWAAPQFGADKPQLLSAASAGDFNYQQISELKPDLILNVRSKADPKVVDSLRKIAPVVGAPEGTPDYAVNWKVQTQLIGSALGKREQADKLIDETTDLQTKLKNENPAFAGKTFVWGSKFGEAYGAALKGDARFDTFAELGFVPNPPVTKLQASGFFANVPVEQVKALDSQVAIFTTISKPFADLQNDPLINSLRVKADGRAIELPETDPIVQALSAGTPQSLKFALEKVTPQLAAATAKVR